MLNFVKKDTIFAHYNGKNIEFRKKLDAYCFIVKASEIFL